MAALKENVCGGLGEKYPQKWMYLSTCSQACVLSEKAGYLLGSGALLDEVHH